MREREREEFPFFLHVGLSHQFFSTLQPDIMLNYPHNDVLVTTARVALFLHLVLNYPVLLHPTRSSINLLFALLYNTVQSCLARKRQYRAESEPLLPKSSHTEFKVQGLSLFPTVSLHPQSSTSDRFPASCGSVRLGSSLVLPFFQQVSYPM